MTLAIISTSSAACHLNTIRPSGCWARPSLSRSSSTTKWMRQLCLSPFPPVKTPNSSTSPTNHLRRAMLPPIRRIACVFMLVMVVVCVPTAYSDPRITQAGLICVNASGTPTPSIVSNFLIVMRDVAKQLNTRLYGFSSIMSPPPAIYALAQCHEDLSDTDCLLCFAQARPIIPRCSVPLADSGRLYLDGCFVRFDYYNFFNETVDHAHDLVTCSNSTNSTASSGHQPSSMAFNDRVDRVLENITRIALESKVLFGSYGFEGVYGLAQCWNTLTMDECRECLTNAASKIKRCLPGVEGRAMNAGCFVRYSNQKFYSVSTSNGSGNIGVIIAITSSAAAATSLIFIGIYLGYKRWLKKREVRNRLFGLPAALRRSNLVFQYEVLEQATNFFDESRKLGQGGAGSVYKGILPDGKVVAVKRLVFNTHQWVDEFFNEINLISGIEHGNLVKLLGCSIEGPESLLVYEFVPNRSLDQVLFENNPIRILSWQERIRIIRGTAAGLAYLHEGCIVKIIHRDIKTSNVLLDENLTAKIADFGLVRRLEPDKSHLSTGIAGTLGYMAPEYLIRGQLSEKADVYSFGVLLLEIISGRKNTVFARGSGSLLQSVWRHYQTNSLPECVDPNLRSRFPFAEASSVMKIGLLCTQASAELRPSMPEVVRMLNNGDIIVPLPKQPPFLNANVLSSDDSSRSSNTNTNTGVSYRITNSEASSVSTRSISLTGR